jgi:hypothetical protein
MIRLFRPPTFFVTFTSDARLWDLLIKAMHTLHALGLNLPNKIKYLQYVHITYLIRVDVVTCAKYYNHNIFFPQTHHKIPMSFKTYFQFYFVIEFHNCGSKHEHGFLWIKKCTYVWSAYK